MDKYIEIIKQRLNPYRFNHSVCVAKCAEKLAEIYNADVQKAYVAGILHDIMKNTPDKEQLDYLKKHNVVLTETELSNPKLYHAISGAYYVKNELKIEDREIIDAIRFHTTGRAKMSLLEKVIYVADFISDDRDYNGIGEIRQAAYRSLEEAMMIGLEFSIQEITQKKQTLHPDSVDAYNELILEGNYE